MMSSLTSSDTRLKSVNIKSEPISIDSCQMDLDSDKFVYNVVFRNVPTSNNEKILVRVLFDIIVYIFLPI